MNEITNDYAPSHLRNICEEAVNRVLKTGKPIPLRLGSAQIRVYRSDNFVSALLVCDDGAIFEGIAKRNPTDPYRHLVGLTLAIYRAVRSSVK